MSGTIPQELREAGAQYRKGAGPDGDSVDLDWLVDRCEQMERILRLQFEDGDLPDRYERELSSPKMRLDSLTGGLKRFAYLKHLYRLWNRGGLDSASSPGRGGSPGSPGVGEGREPDQMRAMVQLLDREPVSVRLSHRTIEITDRSYLALLRMAEHSTRINDLERDVRRIDALIRDIRDRATEEDGDDLSTRDVRRLEHLSRLRIAVRRTVQDHRRAIAANLTTDDGAPADSIDEAPDWADEIGPVDEVALVVGVRRAMSERIERLGERPEHPRDSDAEKLEDWGTPAFLIPFRDFDGRTPVDAAGAGLEAPLASQLAAARADAPPVFESDYGDGPAAGGRT